MTPRASDKDSAIQAFLDQKIADAVDQMLCIPVWFYAPVVPDALEGRQPIVGPEPPLP